MLCVRQQFPASVPLDIPAAVEQALRDLRAPVSSGQRIAVAVGSRGILNLASIVSSVVEHLRAAGARPFIVPAMGSHGGATAEGQAAVLAEYGVCERRLGVPVLASMDTRVIGRTAGGQEVRCSAAALEADGILVVNRIKPHTDFSGRLGSGILKMMVIGLGKHAGAQAFHLAALRHGYEHVLRLISAVLLEAAPILGGIGIVEDQRHQTARIAGLPRDVLVACEEELFALAARMMPKLPFADVDLLIIDRIGKNISGAGMDPNIIGRGVHGYTSTFNAAAGGRPSVKRLFVRDLTPETHGNAIGIGLADFTTTRLVRATDTRVTYINSLTSLTPNSAKLPIHFDTDREAIAAGLTTLGIEDAGIAKVMRIRDTLSLETVELSTAYEPSLAGRADLTIVGASAPMAFDGGGDLMALGGSG
jgi:hypothetical protein